MNTWLQKATAYVEPQIQKTCEEENSIHSKHCMQVVRDKRAMAGEMLVCPLSLWLGRGKSSMQNTVLPFSPFSFVAWFAQLFEELWCQT